jgi:hypothetical protein
MGPPDLEAFTAVDQEVCGDSVIQRFIGGTLKEFPSRYREGSATGSLPIGVRQELLYSTKMEFMSGNEADWAELFKSYAALAARSGDSVARLRDGNRGAFRWHQSALNCWGNRGEQCGLAASEALRQSISFGEKMPNAERAFPFAPLDTTDLPLPPSHCQLLIPFGVNLLLASG